MPIDTATTVGALAAEYPLATRVFARHGIDYCCGGGRPLADVCAEKGLDIETVLTDVRAELASPGAAAMEQWSDAALPDLIEHILTAYHRPLDEELPRIEAMARKVNEVHGHKDPKLAELLSVYLGLKAELEPHMHKEEQILFPMIQRGQGAMADGPIGVMREEHESAGAALEKLRALTNGYEVPEGACNPWRALWAGTARHSVPTRSAITMERGAVSS